MGAKTSAAKAVKTVAKKATPASKPGGKLASKTVSKAAPKVATKVTPKPAVKTAAKSAAVKPAAKTAVKSTAASTKPQTIAKTVTAKHVAVTQPEPQSPLQPIHSSQTAKASMNTETTVSRTASSGVKILTEAEILKAPEKDYMNASHLAFFKNRLQEMEREILRNAGETTEHLRESVIVPDPADRATIEEEHALELRTRDRERKLLKKIQQSILRIDSGDYGYCDETGEPIGIPRLLARPTATLSLEAQERREMKQKMFGD